MRILGFFAALAMLTGCGTPTVSVKKEWTQSILSYSFIPLYPMREDVFVGDIRIHRLDADKSAGLHSRPLARLDRVPSRLVTREGNAPAYLGTEHMPKVSGERIHWQQTVGEREIFTPRDASKRLRLMALPGIDLARISHADTKASGLLGIWNAVFGTTYDSEEAVFVSLTGLETVEIPDALIAGDFKEKAIKMLQPGSQDFLGICVAAKSMGDPQFKQTAISVVTRVAYARGAEFNRKSERRVSVELSADNSAGNGQEDTQNNANTRTTKTLKLNEVFDRPMAFGVDAIMINPAKLYDREIKGNAKGAKSLSQKCDEKAGAFEASPASPYLTGAPNRAMRTSYSGAGKK